MIIKTNRWWIYQQERFPILTNGLLIAAFSFSTVSYSALLRGFLPSIGSVLVANVCTFLFFLQMRIADEFKDFEEDCRYRPYRPVPRGLVSLRELGIVGFACAMIQLGLTLWLNPALTLLLVLVWFYMAVMSQEFFVRDWLKAHPFTYMWTHMLIMPLIDLYATGCDWLTSGKAPPNGLTLFLLVSFFNGMVIEIGRKIRAPKDEETGVETYSFLWGRRNAVCLWLGAMFLTALCAGIAANQINFVVQSTLVLSLLLTSAVAIALTFLVQPTTQLSKRIELTSGLWTLLMYLSLGAAPLLSRTFEL